MRSVLVLFDDTPRAAEGRAWTAAEVDRLTASGCVASARLREAGRVTETFPRPCAWILELEPRGGQSPEQLLEHRAVAEFLRDLRLLGMRPSVLALDGRVG